MQKGFAPILILVGIVVIAVIVAGIYLKLANSNFENCKKMSGSRILESYPLGCQTPDGKIFDEKDWRTLLLLMKKSEPISQTPVIISQTPQSSRIPIVSNFNFIFKYGVGARNELDTFEETYTKDMVSDPAIKIKMSLSKEEMDRIYQKMLEINFFDYPDKFSVTPSTGEPTINVTPCSRYYFKVANDSRIKELSWDDCITNKNEGADKLRELIKYIENIIESKTEYKKLPSPRSGYL